MPKWFRFFVTELLRFTGLVALIALASSLMAQMVDGGTTAEFFRQIDLDRDGVPIWGQFVFACRGSLPILAVALLLLAAGSVFFGSICELPRMGWVRLIVLAISAMPSFLLPFIPYLLQPSRTFIGLASGGILVPAIALAVGDCNLSTVTTQFRESLRHHKNQPHIQTIEALGRSVWVEVWPRSCLTLISSLVGRIPHLFGGLVALEWVFNINGLGIAAYRAVMSTPADLHWLLWICVFCVCIRTGLRMIDLTLRSWWMPETLGDHELAYDADEEGQSKQDLQSHLDDSFPGGSVDLNESSGLLDRLDDWLPARSQDASPPGAWPALRRNIAYYILVRPCHWVHVVIAATVILAFLLMLAGCWFYGDVKTGNSFEDPSGSHWFGTDLAGIDLVSSMRAGIQQLIIPGVVALMLGMIAVPAALLSLHQWLSEGFLRRLVYWADKACLYIAEFVESLPKLLVLLAAFSLLSGGIVVMNVFGFSIEINTMVVRLFALIGLLHAPQVYRAVREELTALNNSVYIEASLVARTRWHQMLFGTIVRNHCMHVLLIQAAVIAAGVLHYDAVLGLLGVRGRGVIFTWGSTLGMGVEAYMQYGPLAWFNTWVLGLPLLAVWLGILSFWLLAEAGKIIWGGYVYRLR